VPLDRNGDAPGSTIEISVRPESIRLLPPAAEDAIPARVEQAAYLGTNVSYLVRTPGGTGLTVLAPKTGDRLSVGSNVAIAWDAADALVLGRDLSAPIPLEEIR
jgi:ABC-type Fe3+/spermidine/putrescine transport system ATPase subunit